MIDVTFLLLIYFMVTTVFALNEDRLSSTLQTRQDEAVGPDSDFQPQVVEIVGDGTEAVYRLGSRLLADRHALRDALRPLPKSAGIFINVHDRVPVGFAVTAIQVARDVGFDQVTYVPAK